MLTHLGNGMPQNIHKFNNTLVSGLGQDNLKAGIIADGHHLPPDILKIIIRTKGIDNLFVVSDSVHVAGLKPGKYTLANRDIELLSCGKIVDKERDCLAGSSATMKDCVKHLRSLNFLTEKEIMKLTYYNPLKFIKKQE